ncbi:MAG: hypothetical protein KDD14_25755, partial [Saprospiraceae bacterium]|nr:hypothetical protein [Saprospiraceae bacterium]
GKAKIPAWIFVTSQEKLDEVVDALDARRIELARLKDRFPLEVDLKQSDIKEVTAKRVLDKNTAAEKMLSELYDKYEGRIKTNTSLERTYRNTSVSRVDFVNLYPYLPYQIDLSISIVSGLRTKRGAQRHVGGSNRTIIKQAQQMLIHPQTNLADKPVGSLVTLDMIYELLYGGSLLPVELTQEIDKIKEYLPRDVMALKVAKSIALLEVVRDLPNTINNIAAVLHPSVEAESIKSEVKTAIQKLQDAQFIRETQEGYKLLTVQEKHWDTQRRGYEPKERNKIEIIEEIINNIYVEPSLKAFRYKNISTFKVGIILRERSIADGSVNLNMYYSDTVGEFQALVDRTKRESREKRNEIYWLFSLTEEIHSQITELFRSKSMISEYSRLQAQSKISKEEMGCLEDERQRERERIMPRLKSLLLKAIESGCSVFRGVEKDANLHGPKLADIQRSMLSTYIPQIYEKLEMGARNLSGNEVEAVFNETRLNRLTPVFYDGDEGLQLITKQVDRYVPNTNAPVAKEIMEYINNQNDYGNTVTGKTLETHFNSPPYGWERDVLRLVLAVIFRAGHLEMISQGQKYKDYNSPSAKIPLVNNTTFRSTTFSP